MTATSRAIAAELAARQLGEHVAALGVGLAVDLVVAVSARLVS